MVLRPNEYPVEECTETVSVDGEVTEPTKSSNPVVFVFVLMVINVVTLSFLRQFTQISTFPVNRSSSDANLQYPHLHLLRND